jgi:pentatricopeptide repeat protein
MRARGIPLNTHTYSAMLNVCIKAGQAELALDVYSQVGGRGQGPQALGIGGGAARRAPERGAREGLERAVSALD